MSDLFSVPDPKSPVYPVPKSPAFPVPQIPINPVPQLPVNPVPKLPVNPAPKLPVNPSAQSPVSTRVPHKETPVSSLTSALLAVLNEPATPSVQSAPMTIPESKKLNSLLFSILASLAPEILSLNMSDLRSHFSDQSGSQKPSQGSIPPSKPLNHQVKISPPEPPVSFQAVLPSLSQNPPVSKTKKETIITLSKHSILGSPVSDIPGNHKTLPSSQFTANIPTANRRSQDPPKSNVLHYQHTITTPKPSPTTSASNIPFNHQQIPTDHYKPKTPTASNVNNNILSHVPPKSNMLYHENLTPSKPSPPGSAVNTIPDNHQTLTDPYTANILYVRSIIKAIRSQVPTLSNILHHENLITQHKAISPNTHVNNSHANHQPLRTYQYTHNSPTVNSAISNRSQNENITAPPIRSADGLLVNNISLNHQTLQKDQVTSNIPVINARLSQVPLQSSTLHQGNLTPLPKLPSSVPESNIPAKHTRSQNDQYISYYPNDNRVINAQEQHKTPKVKDPLAAPNQNHQAVDSLSVHPLTEINSKTNQHHANVDQKAINGTLLHWPAGIEPVDTPNMLPNSSPLVKSENNQLQGNPKRLVLNTRTNPEQNVLDSLAVSIGSNIPNTDRPTSKAVSPTTSNNAIPVYSGHDNTLMVNNHMLSSNREHQFQNIIKALSLNPFELSVLISVLRGKFKNVTPKDGINIAGGFKMHVLNPVQTLQPLSQSSDISYTHAGSLSKWPHENILESKTIANTVDSRTHVTNTNTRQELPSTTNNGTNLHSIPLSSAINAANGNTILPNVPIIGSSQPMSSHQITLTEGIANGNTKKDSIILNQNTRQANDFSSSQSYNSAIKPLSEIPQYFHSGSLSSSSIKKILDMESAMADKKKGIVPGLTSEPNKTQAPTGTSNIRVNETISSSQSFTPQSVHSKGGSIPSELSNTTYPFNTMAQEINASVVSSSVPHYVKHIANNVITSNSQPISIGKFLSQGVPALLTPSVTNATPSVPNSANTTNGNFITSTVSLPMDALTTGSTTNIPIITKAPVHNSITNEHLLHNLQNQPLGLDLSSLTPFEMELLKAYLPKELVSLIPTQSPEQSVAISKTVVSTTGHALSPFINSENTSTMERSIASATNTASAPHLSDHILDFSGFTSFELNMLKSALNEQNTNFIQGMENTIQGSVHPTVSKIYLPLDAKQPSAESLVSSNTVLGTTGPISKTESDPVISSNHASVDAVNANVAEQLNLNPVNANIVQQHNFNSVNTNVAQQLNLNSVNADVAQQHNLNPVNVNVEQPHGLNPINTNVAERSHSLNPVNENVAEQPQAYPHSHSNTYPHTWGLTKKEVDILKSILRGGLLSDIFAEQQTINNPDSNTIPVMSNGIKQTGQQPISIKSHLLSGKQSAHPSIAEHKQGIHSLDLSINNINLPPSIKQGPIMTMTVGRKLISSAAGSSVNNNLSVAKAGISAPHLTGVSMNHYVGKTTSVRKSSVSHNTVIKGIASNIHNSEGVNGIKEASELNGISGSENIPFISPQHVINDPSANASADIIAPGLSNKGSGDLNLMDLDLPINMVAEKNSLSENSDLNLMDLNPPINIVAPNESLSTDVPLNTSSSSERLTSNPAEGNGITNYTPSMMDMTVLEYLGKMLQMPTIEGMKNFIAKYLFPEFANALSTTPTILESTTSPPSENTTTVEPPEPPEPPEEESNSTIAADIEEDEYYDD